MPPSHVFEADIYAKRVAAKLNLSFLIHFNARFL